MVAVGMLVLVLVAVGVLVLVLVGVAVLVGLIVAVGMRVGLGSGLFSTVGNGDSPSAGMPVEVALGGVIVGVSPITASVDAIVGP